MCSCEGELIEGLVAEIVKEICDRLPVEAVPNAVGLEERVPEVVERFRLEKKTSVYFVLIWGMGGIGKTTLGRSIYETLRMQFEAASFVENCGDQKSSQIQDRLRKELLLDENDLRGDIARGRARLKRGLREKKVLIVLDDIKNDFYSIEEVIDTLSLNPGSRILVTSRDQGVFPHENYFSNVFGGERYELAHMGSDESLKLFCLHAFKKPSADPGFEELATRVVEACHGLPLSLEVLGRHLSSGKENELWEEAIIKLRTNKYKDISGRLMISYDALDEDEQQMFLDVACFLIGEKMWRAEYFWDGWVAGWRTGLKKLIELCLVKVGQEKEKRLAMHDQLRDLGRGIVQKESRRTRLWNDEDVRQVLLSKQGLDQIRGLATSLPKLNADLISQMQSLRLLFLNGTVLDGDREGLRGLKIRWLKWSNFPYQNLPQEFDMECLTLLAFDKSSTLFSQSINFGLQVLEVSESPMTQLPSFFGQLKKLRVLKMDRCHRLTNLPSSFGQLKRLRVLKIYDCSLLEELSRDFGSLESLEELRLSKSLITHLPSSFTQLKKLRVLEMDGCSRLKELSADFGSLESLEELRVFKSLITHLPSSFTQLKKLRVLEMNGCTRLKELSADFGSLESLEELQVSESLITQLPSSFTQLKKLRVLKMYHCNLLEELSGDFGSLESLEELCASGTQMTKFPSSFGHLKNLRVLEFHSCFKLKELPEDFGCLESLERLNLSATRITKLPPSFSNLKRLRVLNLFCCDSLEELPENFGSLESLEMLSVTTIATLIPASFLKLKRLRQLNLMRCLQLKELPENIGSLESLEVLDVSYSGITELPPSFRLLKNLRVLRMEACKELEAHLEKFGARDLPHPLDIRMGARRIQIQT